MIKIEKLPELSTFQVVGVHRKTGKPQFVTLLAPSQEDADDLVADTTPEWIVIRDNKDLLDEPFPPSFDPEELRDNGFTWEQIDAMLAPFDHDPF